MLAAKDQIKFCTDKFELNLFFFFFLHLLYFSQLVQIRITGDRFWPPGHMFDTIIYTQVMFLLWYKCCVLLFFALPVGAQSLWHVWLYMLLCVGQLCVGQLSLSRSRTPARRIQVMLLRLHSAGLSLPLPLPYVAVKPVAPPTWQQLPADHTSFSRVTVNFSNGFLHESKHLCIYWLMY